MPKELFEKSWADFLMLHGLVIIINLDYMSYSIFLKIRNKDI